MGGRKKPMLLYEAKISNEVFRLRLENGRRDRPQNKIVIITPKLEHFGFFSLPIICA